MTEERPATKPTPRGSTILRSADRLEELWESRVGAVLRRLGLGGVRTTILTLAVLATLIPALATGWISYRQNRRALEAKLREQLTNVSGQAAREAGLVLKERLYDLKVFAASYEVTEGVERAGGGTRRLPEYLSSVNERFPAYRELLVVAPDQRVVASSARTPGRLGFTGDWMRRARDGDPVLGDPVRAATGGPLTMEVAVPIVSAAGRFLGVLAARLDLGEVAASLDEYRKQSGARLIVVQPDGAVLAADPAGARVTDAALRELRAAGDSVVSYVASDATPVLARLAEVPASDWGAVAEIPAAIAFAQINELRTATVATVLVLLLVVGAFAYGLGLLIVLPLERLSSAAQQVAGGDLDVDVPVTGSGEVSQLGRVFNDMVRRLREGRAELERLSVTDALTGLANRRRLTTELEREVHRGERHERPFAVVMLDVDHFKAFNDTFGHPAGDAVLKRLARILQENARDVDTVARYGGEEFTLILAETDAATAAAIAERIRGAVEADRFSPDGHDAEVNVTMSIGVATFPQNGRTPQALVTAADAALYQSKSAGRNRVTAATVTTTEAPKPRKRRGS